MREDFLDDPRFDDAAVDFALVQLCRVLGVDPESISWDAATETFEGDVQAVIGNILRAKPSVLTKRAVAFRIRRADADSAGTMLSETDWRYFSNEDDAWKASDALGTEYQALYKRDGAAIVAEWEPIETAPRDGTPFLCFHPDDVFSPQTGIDLIWYEPSIKTYTMDGDNEVPFAGITHWMPLPAPPRRASTLSRPNGETP